MLRPSSSFPTRRAGVRGRWRAIASLERPCLQGAASRVRLRTTTLLIGMFWRFGGQHSYSLLLHLGPGIRRAGTYALHQDIVYTMCTITATLVLLWTIITFSSGLL